MLAVLAAAVIHGLPLPQYCAQPPTTADAIACADPELRALAKTSILLGWKRAAATGQLEETGGDRNWPASLDKCATAPCVREAFLDHIETLVEEGPDPPGGRRYQGFQTKVYGQEMTLIDLGEGWTFFRLDGWYHPVPSDWNTYHSGGDHGVVRFVDGEASTGDATQGLKFKQLNARTWHVTQIGNCPCGNLVRLDGLYRMEELRTPRRGKPKAR